MQRKLSINTEPKLLKYSAGYTYNIAMTLYSMLHSVFVCLFLLKINYFSSNILLSRFPPSSPSRSPLLPNPFNFMPSFFLSLSRK